MGSFRDVEARERSSLLAVESYEIDLGVDSSSTLFRCHTVIRFGCYRPQAGTFADLAAAVVNSVVLNGCPLDIAEVWDGSRLTLPGLAANNVLEVEALYPYASDGSGFRRVTDPADSATYVYCKNYPPGTASGSFCCFDDPELRARVELRMSAPPEWTCLANAPVHSRPSPGSAGEWRFAATAPTAPYLVVSAAGPWSTLHERVVRTGGKDVSVAVHAQRSRAGLGQGREITELIARSLISYERELGVPYPYEKCDSLFVREFPSLAFAVPGVIMFDDKVFDNIATREPQYGATVISHEVAHTWIGSLVDCGEDPWLVEALATYLSRTVVAEMVPGSRQWSAAQATVLPDAAYIRDAELIRKLEEKVGRENIFRGLHAFFRSFAHQNAGRAELAACWSQVSGHDLSSWALDR